MNRLRNVTPAMHLRTLAGTALALLASTAASAQLPGASAAAVGMGDNYTAVARGFSAVSWNPANLGLAGNPQSSLALLGVGATGGLGPVGAGDVAEYQGATLPREVREEWLDRVTREGGERGVAGVDVTLLAMSAWRVGFQLSATAQARTNAAPDAVELLLFGNAGRTGQPRDFTAEGSSADGAIVSTAAFSYAQPLGTVGGGRLALGVTGKYITGHGVFTAQDNGTRLTADPLDVEVRFPSIASADDAGATSGKGLGLDVGAAWEQPRWTAALTVRNLVNTFEWDEGELVYEELDTGFETDEEAPEEGEGDDRPVSEAPEALRRRLDDLTYAPVISAGAAFRPSPRLLLSADARTATGDGLRTEARTQVGVGAEFRPVRALPIRAGVAAVTGGYKLSGGVGIEFGPVRLTAGGSLRDDELGSGSSGMLLLSFGAR